MEARRIARFIPEIYRAAVLPGTPLSGILAVMEAMHAPSEEALVEIDKYLDPLRAPDNFALMLTSWLDLDRYLDWTGEREGAGQPRYAAGLGHLRALSMLAAHLMRWRGTRYALEHFLAAATGISGFLVEQNPTDARGRPRPFHIRVHAPAGARRMADLVQRIVDQERPIYVTYEIVFSSTA